MSFEHFFDLRDDTGKYSFQGWRCLNCGEICDPVILAHRLKLVRPSIALSRRLVMAVN